MSVAIMRGMKGVKKTPEINAYLNPVFKVMADNITQNSYYNNLEQDVYKR